MLTRCRMRKTKKFVIDAKMLCDNLLITRREELGRTLKERDL